MNMQSVNFGKRGQVQMQQTAFLLIALTILFVLVGLFVLSFSLSGLKESKANLEEENAILLVSKLANSPELSCEESFGKRMSSCVDFDKAFALKKYSKDYSKFWGINNIEILRIQENISIECTEKNYPECGILRVFVGNSTGTDKSNFITLCRKENFHGTSYDKCEVAKLVVRY